MKLIVFSVIALLALSLPVSASDKETVRLWHRMQDQPYIELLTYALEVTRDEYGPAELTYAKPLVQKRAVTLAAQGEMVDIMVLSSTPFRESQLLPVYVPLTHGLLGYRVCMIAKGNQNKFDGIRELRDWHQAQLIIGQGLHWSDTEILRHNGLRVFEASSYPQLFAMAKQRRFDCFSRSVYEVEKEMRLYSKGQLAIEKQLLFYYPMPHFAFVSPSRPILAERLRKGLLIALQSDFYHQYFNAHFRDTIERLNVEQRIKITLENPLLSADAKAALQRLSPLTDINNTAKIVAFSQY